MGTLKAGFGRVNVNPMMGIDISGYYKVRKADGILDDLEANAIAFSVDNKKTVMICIDALGFSKSIMDDFRASIAEKLDIPKECVFISATHTHTGPSASLSPEDTMDDLQMEYLDFLKNRVVDAAQFALDDLKPAKMGWGIGQAPRVAFVRRFRMKDGSVKTNPGVNNPEILAPIGDVDERVNVLRFDREGAESLILVNFGNHPDVVGGCKISADWPGFVRRTVEKAIDNTKCVFFNGAQGDVNHVNVAPIGGEMNDMFIDFDDVARGYAHARYIGRVVAGGVLQVYDKVKYVDVDSIQAVEQIVKVSANKGTAEELVEAKRIHALHEAGKDEELPYKGMMLTTVVASARRMVTLADGPDFFEIPLTGITLGPVAFVGIPGEPFTGIGRGLKEAEEFDMILPVCCANGYEGYYPMQDSYDEGGYEAGTSRFKAGTAEQLILEGRALLTELGGNK
ncbi:MAG: hypothetical protein E7408_02640 [Ruminococcaceae bacterium]|nr:hypothetical protein [Oscillospiraceae bacterium]